MTEPLPADPQALQLDRAAGDAPLADAPDQSDEWEPELGPIRRSIVSGDRLDKARLIRFVVSPDAEIVPDIEERLPGRGLWVEADATLLQKAVSKHAFNRAARRPVKVSPDLSARVEALLTARCRDAIGLARRAGLAVCGFEKVGAMVRAGRGAVLIAASEGGRDGRRKLRSMAPGLPVVTVLSGTELGLAFGREHVGHAGLGGGPMAQRLLVEGARLAGFRPGAAERAGIAGAPPSRPKRAGLPESESE